MQIGIQAFAATEGGNALPAAQALEDDPELLFRRMSWTDLLCWLCLAQGDLLPWWKSLSYLTASNDPHSFEPA